MGRCSGDSPEMKKKCHDKIFRLQLWIPNEKSKYEYIIFMIYKKKMYRFDMHISNIQLTE